MQCPSVSIELLGLKIPSLLDSGSMVTLVCEGYFTKNILPLLQGLAGNMTEAHSLFQLSATNNQVMPVSKYFEADVSLLGFPIPRVGFLVVQDPNTVLEPQHNTQLPGVIGCNLIWLGCKEFRKVYGSEAFETFHCPNGVHPLVFAQMCSFYHQGKLQAQTSATSNNNVSNVSVNNSPVNVQTLGITSKVNKQVPKANSASALGQVWVDNTWEAICIPANSVKILQGKTSKVTHKILCMIEPRATNNLPMGLVVNRTMVIPRKSKKVPVAVVNTNSYNVWIR